MSYISVVVRSSQPKDNAMRSCGDTWQAEKKYNKSQLDETNGSRRPSTVYANVEKKKGKMRQIKI